MYGKFFASTFTGSMVGAGASVFALWGYIIANVRDGTIELNPRILSVVIGDSEDSIRGAIEFLCAPDEASRNKAHDGRRLIPNGPFLYEVPNHGLYRKIVNEDERREYFRVKKRESRQREKALTVGRVGQSKTVKDSQRMSTHPESESNPDSKASNVSNDTLSGKPDVARGLLAYLNEKAGKAFRDIDTNLKLIRSRLCDPEVTADGIRAMIDRQVLKWRGTAFEEYLRPATLFGKTKFSDYYDQRELPLPPSETNGAKQRDADLHTQIHPKYGW